MVAPGPRGAARGGLLPRRGGTARERRAVRVRGRPRLVPAARAAARSARADPPAGDGRAGGSGVGLGPRSGEEGKGNPKGLPGGRGEGWRRRGYRYRMRVHRPEPRALLVGAQRVLEPGGLLALEIDERRADAVRALARASGWTRVVVREDLFGRPRYALACAAEAA